MKLYLDNEIPEFRKIVMIQDSSSENVFDDINVIIDGLKAYGHTEHNIRTAFLNKCCEWGLLEREN